MKTELEQARSLEVRQRTGQKQSRQEAPRVVSIQRTAMKGGGLEQPSL